MEMEISTIKEVEPIGYIVHKPTKSYFGVYHPIGWFRKMMLRLFFGLEYRKVKKG